MGTMDSLDDAPAPLSPGLVWSRAIEFAAMFVAAPAGLAFFMKAWMVFPAIWLLAAICLLVLLRDPTFERRQLWNAGGVRRAARLVGLSFAVAAPVLAGVLLMFEPDRLFSLPRRNPTLWAIIMVGYPILSVYPQELAFRAYFFHRYAAIFPSKLLILASALAFGYAHIILHNWIAILFTTVGGLLFATTYARTRSLLATCLEHALYGCYIFTVGWGWYFYGGSIGR